MENYEYQIGLIYEDQIFIRKMRQDGYANLLEKYDPEASQRLFDNIEIKGMGWEEAIANSSFVCMILTSPAGEWWRDPDTWKLKVEAEAEGWPYPEWYEADPQKHQERFRKKVREWWSGHVLVDQKVEMLNAGVDDGYYMLKGCDVGQISGNTRALLDGCQVMEMNGRSVAEELRGNSVVQRVCGHATVEEMWNNSVVEELREKSHVLEMYQDAKIGEMWDNAAVSIMSNRAIVERISDSAVVYGMCQDTKVGQVSDNARVREMYGRAIVEKMSDRAAVYGMYQDAKVGKMSDNAHVWEMHDRAIVEKMSDCAAVYGMYQDAKVGKMSDDARVEEMHDRAIVGKMSDDARAWEMHDHASVEKMSGRAVVLEMRQDTKTGETTDCAVVRAEGPARAMEMDAMRRPEEKGMQKSAPDDKGEREEGQKQGFFARRRARRR